MRAKIKRSVAAFGLIATTSPGLLPLASAEVQPSLSASPNPVVESSAPYDRFVRHLPSLVRLALDAPVPSFEKPATPPPPSPVLSWQTDPTISPSERQLLAAKATYVKRVLLPVIQKKGLEVVQPINTQADPVNVPGQFIVSSKSNNHCGSQFYVDTSAGKAQHRIVVSVWGNLNYLANGSVYGHAAYSPGVLSHAESTDNFGYVFPSDKPEEAAAFVNKINARDCHIDPAGP